MEELIQKIQKLSGNEKELFDRIFSLKIETALQKIPPTLVSRYGQAAEKQELVIFSNKILHQETVFNLWRSRRPEPPQTPTLPANDSFDFPLDETPEDEIGRLESNLSYTVSNLTKIGVHHSLVIFRKHDPITLTETDIVDGFTTAFRWFKEIEKRDSQAKIPILFWNYLFRAGGSISHPHLQLLYLHHLPQPLNLFIKELNEYNQRYHSQYWIDLYQLSAALGLAQTIGNLKVIVNLTPTKDRELILLAENWEIVFSDIAKLIKKYLLLGVQSFNLFMQVKNEIQPLYALIVDRGRLDKINCDIGSLELYAFSVVSFDPLEFASKLSFQD
jgi:hypothetical protein